MRTLSIAAVLLGLALGCKQESSLTTSPQTPAPNWGKGAGTNQPDPAAALPRPPSAAPQQAMPPPAGAMDGALISGTVAETMNAATYTYVLVDDGAQKIWAAAPKFDVKVGDRVVVPQGAPMSQFKSATLNRTFELIYFVPSVSKAGAAAPAAAAAAPVAAGKDPAPAAHGAPAVETVDVKNVALAPGGKRIEQIFSSSAALAGKPVSVRGKVVKYNGGVMGKNWLHIQDGSGKAGTNDLTLTTATEAKVGDMVLVKGNVTLNKDFGYGYKYDVILEDATVTVE